MKIIEFPLPTDASDPRWIAYVELFNQAGRELLDSDLWDDEPVSRLEGAQADTTHRIRRFLAYVDDQPVGCAVMRINIVDEPNAAGVDIYVRQQDRRQGVGEALAKAVTAALPPTLERIELWVPAPIPTDDGLPSPTGHGAVPAGHPGIIMALKYGFKLGQVERMSRYDLVNPPADAQLLLEQARAAAGPDYELVRWEGETPEQYLTGIARLKERMATDVPAGEITVVETTWDEDRVRKLDQEIQVTMRPFKAAVLHVPTGAVVGLTELMVSRSQPANFVDQWDTIVLSEHRGHRLGMWLKAANIQQVREAVPEALAIITYNAEENRHMLSVNEALGFEGIRVEGAFERKLG